MTKDINISIDTIKRHSKRLHKILQQKGIINQDFKLTAIQEIFSQSLGCNNWFELNEILKEKDKTQFLQRFHNLHEYRKDKKLVMLITGSNTIYRCIELFLSPHCYTMFFETIEDAIKYSQLTEKELQPELIIYDSLTEINPAFNANKIWKNIPIIFLTGDKKYQLQNKSEKPVNFTKSSMIEEIENFKKIINKNKGFVDQEYWNKLMKLHNINNDKSSFDKVAVSYLHHFKEPALEWNEELIDHEYKKPELKLTDIHHSYLCKPFTKEELYKVVYKSI